MFSFHLLNKSRSARAGVFNTPRGMIPTPAFMPVGTLGCIKGVSFDQIKKSNVPVILANTYHLYLRPGHELIASLGGLHSFIGWQRPILTDSGGFQIFSLSKLKKVDEKGYGFQSHIDGSRHFFTPTKALEIQRHLGSDIVMPLDECIEFHTEEKKVRQSVSRTLKWAEEQKTYFEKKMDGNQQQLFGIVQGAGCQRERERCALRLMELDFFGYAIGGLSVGESKEELYTLSEFVTSMLPEQKPRYLMGVGSPEDLVEGVERGVDMFDCVMATRLGRNATVFTRMGRLNLRNADFSHDGEPLESGCQCFTCRTHSRAYLRHLFKANEMNGPILATIHNLHYFQQLMDEMRESILRNEFERFKKTFYQDYKNSPRAQT